jgi:hypothetical protein
MVSTLLQRSNPPVQRGATRQAQLHQDRHDVQILGAVLNDDPAARQWFGQRLIDDDPGRWLVLQGLDGGRSAHLSGGLRTA